MFSVVGEGSALVDSVGSPVVGDPVVGAPDVGAPVDGVPVDDGTAGPALR